ncbi:MAG TPA: hypothetical protein VES95_01960 [Dermatophilaceae bacterium]|nr:hypothetical protein [Dermatophilaceae bacterium]
MRHFPDPLDREVDVADDTFVRAAPAVLRAVLDVEGATEVLWPHLAPFLTVLRDRGTKGMRWQLSGPLVGECEVWLEPVADGTVVHHYVRGRLTGTRPRARRWSDAHVRRWKRTVHRVKDVLEDGVR